MKKPPIIWVNVILFTVVALIALIGVPLYGYFVGYDAFTIGFALFCFIYCGISITAGYHRLWSHKTYDAHPVLKVIFALGGAFALQNSALHWSSDHRVHHRHVDVNDKDPYSAKRGFWFSHMGWMCREYQAERYSDYSNCRDLQKDKIVMWQHKHYMALLLIMNIGVPVFVGWLNGDVIGMFLLAGWFRLFLTHHTTFFINSLAHIWGKQPYTDKNTARDNGVLAFLTFGEGYHNFHHIFEYDYRNGIRWWQFDPTKWLIRACSWVNLTKNLRRCPEERIEKARAAMTLQRAQQRLSGKPDTDALLEKLQAEYDQLIEKITDYYKVKKQVLELKKTRVLKQYENIDVVKRYEELKVLLAAQRRHWQMLNAQFAS